MENSSIDFWKILSFGLIVLVLFLTVADVSVRPRFMGWHGRAETSEQQPREQIQQSQPSPSTGGGMVGGC